MAAADQRVVIVGAGHAGGTVAANLRQMGFGGRIVLLGAEPIAPYQRPPLSKAWLKGEADAEALMLRPRAFYAEAGIDLRLGVEVAAIDRRPAPDATGGGGTVLSTDGEAWPYDVLVLATGARARRLDIPGVALDGVLELRTAADAERLKTALERRPQGRPPRLVVIGGGYVGLEAAASARALGADAVVVEREARLLARVACLPLSDFFRDLHEDRGVRFELGADVVALDGADGVVSGVALSTGDRLTADLVLVGVGAVANQELAAAAGLACANGIVVDAQARTADPSILAVGDCTHRPLPLYGRTGRLESVPSALEQARQAAAAIAGRPQPGPEVPWFWSDQYDVKLQIAGMPFDAEAVVVRGDLLAGRFAVFHLDAASRVQAVEAVNAPPEFMAGRQIIAARKAVAPDRLRDMSTPMKEVAA